MKRRHLSMIVALPLALAFAGAAGAQQAPQSQPQQQPQPQTQPMQQTIPPTSTETMQCASGTNCYDNSTTDRDANGNGMRNRFSSLAGSKGYVTQSEAGGDPWLANHFPQCDANHDGRLTRSEYRTCHRQNDRRQ